MSTPAGQKGVPRHAPNAGGVGSASPRRGLAILDTSVLVSFLALNRADLLAAHPDYRFIVTDHVDGEIADHYPDQRGRLEAAMHQGLFERTTVADLREVADFGRLIRTLGAGESAALAAGFHRNLPVAIDDHTARNSASRILGALSFLTAELIMVGLIWRGILSIAQADAIKAEWESQHRLPLPFGSFAERV